MERELVLQKISRPGILGYIGASIVIGRWSLRSHRIDEGVNKIYRVKLATYGEETLIVDEVSATAAADRFEEIQSTVELADVLFGWLD